MSAMVRFNSKKGKIMELNVNVNVRIENLDQILAALSTLVTVSTALPAVPTEDKPVRRGRPRKAVEKTEEPKAEEPKAEEPKDLLPALRAQCMALSRVAGADRVLQVIKSFGFKGLTAVPVEKHAELLQILVDEIKAAEDK